MRSRIGGLGPPLVILAAVVLGGALGMWNPEITQDAQSNLVYADQVLAGRVPHRDFFATYGPANYYVLAAAFGVFESSVEVHRLVALAYELALALGVYACCHSRGRVIALAAALTTICYLGLIELTAYAWFGGIATILAAVAILQRPLGRWWVALAGALLASTALWRIELVLAAALCSVPFLLGRRDRLHACIAGAFVGLVPVVGYGLVAGPEWVSNVVTRAGIDAGYTQLDPYVLVGAVVLVAVVVAMGVLGRRRRDRSALFVAVFVIVQLPQLWQRPDVLHVAFVAVAALPMAVAHLVPFRSGRAEQGDRGVDTGLIGPLARVWLVGVAATIGLSGALALVAQPWNQVDRVTVDGRSVIARPDLAPKIRETVAALQRAKGNGTVFIGAEDLSKPSLTWVMFYHLLPPEDAAGYYLEIPPGLDLAQQAQLANDLRQAQALLLTEFSDEERQRLFPRLPDLSELADDVVRELFCPVETKSYGEVLSRCR